MIVLHSKLDIASSIVVFFLMNLTYFIAYYTFQKVSLNGYFVDAIEYNSVP